MVSPKKVMGLAKNILKAQFGRDFEIKLKVNANQAQHL